jgi:hypothetical protein
MTFVLYKHTFRLLSIERSMMCYKADQMVNMTGDIIHQVRKVIFLIS